MTNVNILFFNIPHLSVGRGGEVWVREVIDFLNRKHFKAKLITTDCCNQGEVKVNFEYKVIKLKRKFGLHLYDFNEIEEDIKWADVVYYFNSFIGSHIPLILHKKELYKKIIFGHHAKNDWNLIQRTYYSITNKFLKDFGYHHVLTKYYYDKLIRKGFKRVFVIPNFIDLEKFRPKEKKSEFTVVSPGAVSVEKGFDTLQVVANKLHDVNIYLTGKDLPKGIILPKNVKYLGYIDDNSKVELLSSSHVCLLPTKAETFSITLLECLVTGNLVVARDLPELREVSGNIPSAFFARNDQEFIDNILKVKEIYEKDRGRFDELSLMSVKRASNFEKNKVLSDFESKLLEIYNASLNLD
ncbi:MAG: glycosyltransferase family 4 protein [Candidatus Rehaiarchaeum fermentans]|nr:glycosyltransferase family 4 protein [Candidatus Rehaiarchaeum fermentans]